MEESRFTVGGRVFSFEEFSRPVDDTSSRRIDGISASSEKSSLGRHPSKERVEKWWWRERKAEKK